ncbi:MAG: lysylphosphatidylglycerol synthase domain-containing protein [Phycisphaerales bacterium]
MQDAAPTPPSRWTPGKLAVQGVGLLLGAGLFVWAVRSVLSEKNQPALEKLRHAGPQDIAVLVGLTLLSLFINGVMFWLTLRPVRRVPLGETIAINAIAAFLTILPLKLGFFLRALIHYRRHAVGARTLFAWLAGFAGISVGTLAVLTGVSLWRRDVDGVWVGAVLVGLLVLGGLVVAAGHAARRSPLLARVSLGADVIARDPVAVFGHIGLRVVDIATYAARFYVAAKITSLPISAAGSALMGSTYLLLNAAAPAGALGVAEMGTAGVAGLAGVEKDHAALLALTTTAALSMTSGVCAVLAWAWLRPDRLIGGTRVVA